MRAGDELNEVSIRLDRVTVGSAGEGHVRACGVSNEFTADVLGIGSGLAEERDGGDNELGIVCGEFGRRHAGCRKLRRPAREDDCIRRSEEAVEGDCIVRRQDHVSLARIQVEIHPATTRIGNIAREGSHGTGAVAGWGFYLDDIGAEASKELAAERAGDAFGQFDDSESVENAGHGLGLYEAGRL
jgi:hypothetical protein